MSRALDDYRALRTDCGVLDLAGWCVLRLEGPDAREFLQGLATQDLARAVEPAAATSLFLNEKGRPLAVAWITAAEDGASAAVIADESARSTLRAHFERFRVMEDVEFEGPEGMPRVLGVAGPRRAERIGALAEAVPGARAVHAGPLSFLLIPAETPAGALPAFAVSEAAEAWRLAVGLPKGGVDFDAERIATELSLSDAISFDKGCYVGQEVVARTSQRGSVRRRRIGFRFPWPGTPLERRTELRAGGSAAGFVTSSAPEPGTNCGLGMGYLSSDTLPSTVDVLAVRGGSSTHLDVRGWPL